MKRAIGVLLLMLCGAYAQAGVLDPECTAEKAAKSAAMKATIGVSGRCSAKEAVSDSMHMDAKKEAVSDAKKRVSGRVDDAKQNAGHKVIKKAISN